MLFAYFFCVTVIPVVLCPSLSSQNSLLAIYKWLHAVRYECRWCCVTDDYQFIYFYLLRIKLQENEVVMTNIYSSYCCSFIHSFTPFINMPTNQPTVRPHLIICAFNSSPCIIPICLHPYNTVFQLHSHSQSAFWLITVNRMPVLYAVCCAECECWNFVRY